MDNLLNIVITLSAVIGFVINLIALLGIYSKLSIMTYQHRLMWSDFMLRKNLNGEEAKNKIL